MQFGEKLQIEVVDKPQGKVIRLKGTIGTEEVDLLRPHFLRVLSGKPKLVVFDLGELQFISSPGLGALASFRRSLQGINAQGFLAAIPEKLQSVLKLAGMTQLYGVHATVDDALTAPPPPKKWPPLP